ncbi:MAG: CPBP family intramembrane metalloprotease [Clostridiales bacterium]|nr:CPBP family intramembrane metalloprotease [Clostridiales bacterium]
MSYERTAKRSALLKCAIYTALFLIGYVIGKLTDSDVIKISKYVILAAAGIVLFRDVFSQGLKDWKEKPVKNVIWVLLGFVAMFIAQIIFSIPGSIIFPEYYGMNTDSVENAMRVLSPLIYVPVMGILGPVAEEIMFRLVLVEKPKSKVPAAIPVILSGLLFCVYHMHALTLPEFLSCLPHCGCGIVLSIVVLKSRNFTAACLIHVLFNLLCLLVYTFGA